MFTKGDTVVFKGRFVDILLESVDVRKNHVCANDEEKGMSVALKRRL